MKLFLKIRNVEKNTRAKTCYLAIRTWLIFESTFIAFMYLLQAKDFSEVEQREPCFNYYLA